MGSDWCCRCEGDCPCEYCSDGGPERLRVVLSGIIDAACSGSPGCSQLNQPYTLPFQPGGGDCVRYVGQTCRGLLIDIPACCCWGAGGWAYPMASFCGSTCGGDGWLRTMGLSVGYNATTGKYELAVSLEVWCNPLTAQYVAYWKKEFASKPACKDWSSEAVPYCTQFHPLGTPVTCDASSSTCLVTAL